MFTIDRKRDSVERLANRTSHRWNVAAESINLLECRSQQLAEVGPRDGEPQSSVLVEMLDRRQLRAPDSDENFDDAMKRVSGRCGVVDAGGQRLHGDVHQLLYTELDVLKDDALNADTHVLAEFGVDTLKRGTPHLEQRRVPLHPCAGRDFEADHEAMLFG